MASIAGRRFPGVSVEILQNLRESFNSLATMGQSTMGFDDDFDPDFNEIEGTEPGLTPEENRDVAIAVIETLRDAGLDLSGYEDVFSPEPRVLLPRAEDKKPAPSPFSVTELVVSSDGGVSWEALGHARNFKVENRGVLSGSYVIGRHRTYTLDLVSDPRQCQLVNKLTGVSLHIRLPVTKTFCGVISESTFATEPFSELLVNLTIRETA